MGVLPLQFAAGENAAALGLRGDESFDIEPVHAGTRELAVTATTGSGEQKRWRVRVRIDTPKEWEYYRHGGILHYAIRQLLD
jgi:aconitate hydratase